MGSLIARLALLALVLGAGPARSDELSELRARNDRLEATVRELTLQLAEVLAERDDLQARLEQALSQVEAPPTAAPGPAVTTGAAATAVAPAAAAPAPDPDTVTDEVVVATSAAAATAASAPSVEAPTSDPACDVEEVLRGYKRSSKANRALGEWLESGDRLQVCSTEALMQLRKAVKFDLLGYEKPVLAMIDKELEAR